ncbi:MAG: glycosyltransferase family 39 protein [Thermoanaerobaculia bacterium]
MTDEDTTRPSRRGALRHSPWFWGAVLVGVGLRVIGLFQQVLVADEIHAYRYSLLLGFPDVLVSYPFTANSPPLNVWLRLLVDLDLHPGELALRIPVLAAGLALLVLPPLWIDRRLGRPVALALAWLLAISPHFVYYSRFLRPYIGFALLTAVAAAAFWDWWRTGRTASGILYAVAGAAATYLHLLAAPFVAAPALFLLVERAVSGRSAWPPWRRLLGVGGLAVGLVLAFVVPAWPNLHKLASSRRQPVAASLDDVTNGLIVLSGSTSRLVTLLFWGAVVVGIVRLARREGAFCRFLLILTVCQAVAVPLLSPTFINNPMILARYVLPALLPLLVLIAAALTPSRRGTWWTGAPAALFVGAAFVTGPLIDPALYRDSLGLRPALLAVHLPDDRTRWSLPPVYEPITASPDGTVIEFPVRPMQRFFNTLWDYQEVHRHRVIISPGDQLLSDPRLGLRSIVAPGPESFLASDARWLVIHRDWIAELGPDLGFQGPYSPSYHARIADMLDRIDRGAQAMCRTLTKTWGPPDHRSGDIWIWDLERVRGE